MWKFLVIYSYFSSQSQTQNGGVALYVKSGLTPILRPDLGKDSIDFESVWVEVENKNGKNYLFCCTYRHPSSDIDTFCEYLQETLSNPTVFNKQVFILGDFNINLLKYNIDTPITNYVISFFQNNFFHISFILLEYLSILPPLLTISFQTSQKMKP